APADPTETPATSAPATDPTKPADSSKTVLGDVDLNGNVDITDISVLSLAILDKKLPTGQAFTNADVDADKEVGLTDLASLKQYVSKVITKFPAEQ
ncbi:MAG: dockerin type I repeat-containing protein, partial [Oscillospiraceae bacterium]|nr:dockerin type I repeat-containing protein [Oscillospiraceae bacterium]